MEGFYYCQSDTRYEGSHDNLLEEHLFTERRAALRNLLSIIFTESYKLEHSELLKSYINRSSVSLEIEEYGYLGDLGLFKESYLQSTVSGDDDSVIANRIITMGQKHKAKLSSKIQLEEEIQNRIKIYLGYTYRAISVESLLILESALLQFNRAEQRINHDYAGITMKLCKVFERELNILIFQSWKDKLLKSMTTVSLKDQLETAEINGDETMRKLANWLLKRDKIDLGSMAYSIRRLIENCDNEMLQHFKEHISDLNNREFILS